MTDNVGAFQRQRPGCLGVIPVEADHDADLGLSDLPDQKSCVAWAKKQRFFEKQMSLTIASDKSSRTDRDGRIVISRSRPLRQTGDDHHLCLLRKIEQARCGASVRDRL